MATNAFRSAAPLPGSHVIGSVTDTWMEQVLDKSPLGILQMDLNGRIQYANECVQAMLGTQSCVDRVILEFAPDPSVAEFIRERLSRRKQGNAEEFELMLRRLEDERLVPVRVAAMPIFDEQGAAIGSFSILRSLELEHAVKSVNETISGARTVQDLLEGVACVLREMVGYDAFFVSLFSSDSKHAEILFEDPPRTVEWRARWFPVHAEISKALRDNPGLPQRLGDLLRLHEGSEQNPSAQSLKRLIEKGYEWMLRYPVHSEGRQVGTLSLIRKAGHSFSSDESKFFFELPLDKALLVALHIQSRSEIEFRLTLSKEISGKENDKELFDTLVRRIAEHYEWSHVSLFGADPGREKLVLRNQAGINPTYTMPEDYEQDSCEGILGFAYKNRQDVNIANVDTDPEFHHLYKPSPIPAIRSEACLCIVCGNEVCALLNIEDKRESAISSDDMKALAVVLAEIRSIIEQRRKDNVALAALRETTSALFVLTSNGTITQTNPGAEALLGLPREKLVGNKLSSFIQDRNVGAVVDRSATSRGEVVFTNAEGKPVCTIVQGISPEHSLGQRLLIARPFYQQKKAEELELLAGMYAELSRQINTPLSLISTGLREIASQTPVESRFTTILEGLFKQLKKVELTYDKLLFYGSPELLNQIHTTTVYFQQFLCDVLRELPVKESEKVEIDYRSAVRYLDIDPAQLSFVLETLLSYLLQFAPPERNLKLAVKDEASSIHVKVSGPYPERGRLGQFASEEERTLSRAFEDFAVARKTLERIILNHQGKLHEPVIARSRISFSFDIPHPEVS